jgi:hypothetical protein
MRMSGDDWLERSFDSAVGPSVRALGPTLGPNALHFQHQSRHAGGEPFSVVETTWTSLSNVIAARSSLLGNPRASCPVKRFSVCCHTSARECEGLGCPTVTRLSVLEIRLMTCKTQQVHLQAWTASTSGLCLAPLFRCLCFRSTVHL